MYVRQDGLNLHRRSSGMNSRFITRVMRNSAPTSDHQSESLPDYNLGTIHHFITDVGDAHESLSLANRFTRQQTHLLKITRELWSRWKTAKPLYGDLLSKKPRPADDRKLRF